MDKESKGTHSQPNKENDEKSSTPESNTSTSSGNMITNNRSPAYVAISGIAASPPQFVTMDEIMSAANGLKNMQLAHEIAVDKDFKIAQYEPPENSLEKAVKDAVHKAFWDLLSEELSGDPPVYTRAMILLEEVKQTLLDLLYPQHNKLIQEINEMLDIPLIQQQAVNGALDFLGYAQYVINVMGRICAPARDENINQLKEMTDPIEIFKGVFETLSIMRMDLANFNIQLVRSNLLAQSVDYEKKKFAEVLAVQGGIDSLERTKLWLKRHIERSPSGNYADIMPAAYLELFEWNPEDEFPDTVVMDAVRHRELGYRLYQIIICGSVLLVTLSRAALSLQNNTNLKEKLLHDVGILLQEVHNDEHLKKTLPNIAVQVVELLKKYSSDQDTLASSMDMDSSFEESLVGLINDIQRPDHNVRRIVRQRVTEFLHFALSSLPSLPQQVPPGLTSLKPQLLSVTGSIIRLYKYNLAVFGEYYSQIIAKIKEESTVPT